MSRSKVDDKLGDFPGLRLNEICIWISSIVPVDVKGPFLVGEKQRVVSCCVFVDLFFSPTTTRRWVIIEQKYTKHNNRAEDVETYMIIMCRREKGDIIGVEYLHHNRRGIILLEHIFCAERLFPRLL